MSKNILIVENDVKLKLELENILVVYNEEEATHPIKDLECIVIDNHNISITCRLLEKIAEYNVPLIITNKSHIPCGYYFPISSNARVSKVLKKQIEFDKNKNEVWNDIVKWKIRNQKKVLEILFNDTNVIQAMNVLMETVEKGDATNREGHAAKIYFNKLMDTTFSRGNDEIILNSALNYGYAIIRSQIAKNAIGYGLNCQLGLHHKSEYNDFNLVDDLMEPFRPLVDIYCYKLMKNEKFFVHKHKMNVIKILYSKIKYNDNLMEITNVINNYVMQFSKLITSENADLESIEYPKVENAEFSFDDFKFEQIEEDYEYLLFGEQEDDEV